MKLIVTLLALSLSSLSLAQGLSPFVGDYTLKSAVLGACNTNARVEATGTLIKIINPDPRDNRGWATTQLTPGVTQSRLTPHVNNEVRTSVVGRTVMVETKTIRNGSESAFVKDTYRFEDKNGKKSLTISPSTETRGNVSGYGSICVYEKI